VTTILLFASLQAAADGQDTKNTILNIRILLYLQSLYKQKYNIIINKNTRLHKPSNTNKHFAWCHVTYGMCVAVPQENAYLAQVCVFLNLASLVNK